MAQSSSGRSVHARPLRLGVFLALGVLLASTLFVLPVPAAAAHPGSATSRVAPLAATPEAAPLAASGAAGPLSTQAENALGTPAWSNITSSAGAAPPPRSYGRSFAFDPVDGYSVLFGGYSASGGYLSDTWLFEQGHWKQIHPTTAPSARDHGTFAWDPTDGYLLMFGGSGNAGAYSDTWTFLHGNWTALTPSTHPSARWASSMTWDAAAGDLLLFGGCAGGSAIGDTWTFLGGAWTQLHPVGHPAARENTALAFDPIDNYTLLFGGDNYGSGSDSDTWVFSAGNWTQLHPVDHPSARSQSGFGWDASISSLVLFGGGPYTGGTNGDTWTFARDVWTLLPLPTAPAPRDFGILAPYPPGNELVLFSGAGAIGDFDDTWAFYQLNLSASASATSGVVPLTVNFTANVSGAQGPLSPLWNLGDGNTSANLTANDTYSVPGQYFPSVRVTDANGSTATIILRVVVGPALSGSALAAPTSGTVPLTVQCQGLAAGGVPPYSFAWSSGSGNQSSAPSPAFIYGAPGHYYLTVTILDSGGTFLSRGFNVTVNASPVQPLVVGLTESATRGPAPLTVFFAGSVGGGVGPFKFAWQFPDGTTSDLTSVSHTFTSAGVSVTTLSVTDARGTARTSSATITVGPGLSVMASVTPQTTTLRTPVTFNASAVGGQAPYSFVWDFGDSLGAASANSTHSYGAPGSYPVTVHVVDGLGTSVTQNFTVTVTGSTNTTTPPPATKGSSTSAAGPSELEVLLIGLAVGVAATVGVVEILRRRGARR